MELLEQIANKEWIDKINHVHASGKLFYVKVKNSCNTYVILLLLICAKFWALIYFRSPDIDFL